MLIYILIGVAALLAILVAVIATRPSDFRVSRSATFHAAPSAIFEHVNSLRNWKAWSPWAKLDPNATETHSGPASGVGSSFAWAGNNKVGEGKMTVIESQPGALVRLRIEFLKPMKATNTAEFSFLPQGTRTLVTWSMWGKNNFAGKAFGLFVNCDRMIGTDFEKGLASLKSISEQRDPVPTA